VIKDPLTVWDGQFPYDALAPAGITPGSTREEVEDASFTLMAEGLMNPATQKAWHELRDLQRRLLVDFLLYDIDPLTDIGAARDRIRQQLADPGEPAELAAAITVPAELLDGLAEELNEITIEAPPPPDVPAALAAIPSRHLMDSLVHFDR
jgi:hypothetical protein